MEQIAGQQRLNSVRLQKAPIKLLVRINTRHFNTRSLPCEGFQSEGAPVHFRNIRIKDQ